MYNDKLRGPRGPTGPRGPRGLTGPSGSGGGDGSAWYDGAGAPAGGLGDNGDYYLRTSNGDVYTKAGGVWSVTGNIEGSAGADGADGDDGAAGAPGRSGSAGPGGDEGPRGEDGITRIIRPSDRLDLSLFDDRADMLAWYAADSPKNILAAGNPYTLTTAKDMGSNGGDAAPTSGTVERWKNLLNGKPVFSWPAGGAPFNQLILPVKGALTAFFVIRPIANGTFQNLYQGVTLGATTFYWDNTGPRYQVGTTANTTNSVAGTWKIVFVFHYNTGLNPQARVIENDVSLYNGAAGAAGTPIPGTSGVPSNITLNMFKAGASFPWASYCAEWGFFAVDKFATIAPLRAYLRQKYATF
jgi:hypothetical protein